MDKKDFFIFSLSSLFLFILCTVIAFVLNETVCMIIGVCLTLSTIGTIILKTKE